MFQVLDLTKYDEGNRVVQLLMTINLCQQILDFMNEPITEITIQQKEFKKKPNLKGCSFISQ